MRAYYNEFDPFAAAWLTALIAEGHIAAGDVDTRSITEVTPGDLDGYTQCHFFAGIGGWSYALRLGGWPDTRPVWTGSCPCQPFSAAGKGLGEADPRHLWPEFRRLIAVCRPASILGEQVASAAGRTWLAGVRADLEGMGYRVGAADLCAASAGAPHIRQRLFWVAESTGRRHSEHQRDARGMAGAAGGRESEESESRGLAQTVGHRGETGGLADLHGERCHRESVRLCKRGSQQAGAEVAGSGATGGLADTADKRTGRPVEAVTGSDEPQDGILGAHGRSGTGGLADPEYPEWGAERQVHTDTSGRAGFGGCSHPRGLGHPNVEGRSGQPLGLLCTTHQGNFWDAYDLLPCLDGKARRTQPGLFPLAHGVPNRVGTLRGAGNAIVAPLAAAFVSAYLEVA